MQLELWERTRSADGEANGSSVRGLCPEAVVERVEQGSKVAGGVATQGGAQLGIFVGIGARPTLFSVRAWVGRLAWWGTGLVGDTRQAQVLDDGAAG